MTDTDYSSPMESDHAASLSVMVGLKASIDTMASEMTAQRKARERRERLAPIDTPIIMSGTSAASGSLLLSMQGPPEGRFWEIRRLVIGGAQVNSVVAGTAYVIIAAHSPSVDLSTINLVDVATTLPLVAFYGTRQFTIQERENIYVVITMPTASTPYSVGGKALDYPTSARVELTD